MSYAEQVEALAGEEGILGVTLLDIPYRLRQRIGGQTEWSQSRSLLAREEDDGKGYPVPGFVAWTSTRSFIKESGHGKEIKVVFLEERDGG